MDLSAERWEGVTPAERDAFARSLAKQLPSGFTFQAIRRFQLCEWQHHVALYQQGSASFALIPGNTVSLGFGADRRWEPNPDELESWQSTSEEYEIDKTIQQYIAEVTLPVRQVELTPFLIETTATEVGWETIATHDPEVKAILREYGTHSSVEVSLGGVTTRVRREVEGPVVAERALSKTHGQLALELANNGFRFPTSDEWEYACSGGAPTLFRWGDHVPCDRYPTDVSPVESAWRKKWVLSAGKLEHPAAGFASDWDYHRQPNSFSLSIASDPYKYELVDEIGVTRGGDGGCTICGGAGFFIGWLTLASAYFEEQSCKHDPAKPISQGYTVGRRVLELL